VGPVVVAGTLSSARSDLAAVGLTEEQLKETGRKYKVGKFSFLASGRARCLDDTEGFVLNQGVAKGVFDENRATDILLDAGQISMRVVGVRHSNVDKEPRHSYLGHYLVPASTQLIGNHDFKIRVRLPARGSTRCESPGGR
jgi:hypothetical protein